MVLRILIGLLLLSAVQTTAQNRIFLNHVSNSADHGYDTEQTVSAQRIDLMTLDTDDLAGKFIRILSDERQRRFKANLEQDSLLNRIALSGIQTYSRSKFTYGKIWKMEERNIKYALQREESRYKVYSAHAFAIDMLDLEFAESFYYNSKVGTSSLGLYKGNSPKLMDPEDPDYEEPVPVESISEELFKERVLKLISKGVYRNDFLSKKFTRVGVAMKMDKQSLNRNRRPQLFVILIFGGKQLQSLKIPPGLMDDQHAKLEE